MPFLMKISTIRYTKDGKRVASSTKGAKRITETSVKWYGVWKENGRVVARVPLSADKRSATAMMVDLDRARERDGANLSDPFKADKLASIAVHLSAYIGDLTAKGRDAEYVRSTENTLNRATTQCGFKCLADFTGDKLDAFLNSLTCSSRRKNAYRGALVQFSNWLVLKRKLGTNPFTGVATAEKQPERTRRSLSVAELETLLLTARERPLRDALTIRRGKCRGELTARLTQSVSEKKTLLGWERWLTFKTAIFTGLRRGELKELRIEHLTLGTEPELTLPGKFTKNGKDARLPLRSDHAEEMRQWIKATNRKPTDKLFRIGGGHSAMDGLRRDLAGASIPYEHNGRVFDWHCFRVQFATLLTASRVHERIRLLLMRHADRHLTDHYDDAEHHWEAMREAVNSLPALTYQTAEERAEEHERIISSLDAMNDYIKDEGYVPKE